MWRRAEMTLFLVWGMVLALEAQEKPSIGLRPGDPTPPLHATAVNGPYQGKRVCYTTVYQGAPTMYLFVSDEKVAPLVAQLDKVLQKHPSVRGIIVAVAGPDYAPRLHLFVKLHQLKTPLAYLEKGSQDPDLKPWKLPSVRGLAVIVAAQKKVVETFLNPGEKDLPRIEKAIAKVEGGRR